MHFSNPLLSKLPKTILASLKDFIADLEYNPSNDKYQSTSTIIFQRGLHRCYFLITYVTPKYFNPNFATPGAYLDPYYVDYTNSKRHLKPNFPNINVKCIEGHWSNHELWDQVGSYLITKKEQTNICFTFFMRLLSPDYEDIILDYLHVPHCKRSDKILLLYMFRSGILIRESQEYRDAFEHSLSTSTAWRFGSLHNDVTWKRTIEHFRGIQLNFYTF